MNNTILTPTELANYLRVSAQKIYSMTKAGEIPYFKIGKKIFYSKETIDIWIQNQELYLKPIEEDQTKVKSINN